MKPVQVIKAILFSDVVIASCAVLGASFFTAFIWFYLSWLAYEDRYGISFLDFVRVSF